MYEYMEERIRKAAQYIIENGATVRDTAVQFGISKSTVHKDMSDRLPYLDARAAAAVNKVLQKNKAERHIRGGMATLKKYRSMAENAKQRPRSSDA